MSLNQSGENGNERLRSLLEKLDDKKANIGIIGLGYVGLPLALLFAQAGQCVTAVDIDPNKVEKLKKGQSYFHHIPSEAIARQLQSKRIEPTTDFSRLRASDAIIICVPTPLGEHREPDLTFIRKTAEAIAPHLQRGQLVALESTTYPGTTEEVVLAELRKSGLDCPVSAYSVDGTSVQWQEAEKADFFLAFSPEREDPGNPDVRNRQVPKVIGGVNGASALAAQAVYRQAFEKTLLVSSARVAEMTKLLENIYRSVNIALVNELKLLCGRMDIDIWEVIQAAKTKPFGFQAFYPGPGLGGHCIPIDPFYLTWKAQEYDFPTRFIELAGEINTRMPEEVVATLMHALEQRRKCLNGSKILVLGVAYKKDVDDTRESPSLRIIELLMARGAQVQYHDPFVPRMYRTRKNDFHMSSVDLTPGTLAGFDAAVIVTDHSAVDYAAVVRHTPLVVDTRNATARVREQREKIVKA